MAVLGIGAPLATLPSLVDTAPMPNAGSDDNAESPAQCTDDDERDATTAIPALPQQDPDAI
jgi:hypothetical protein